ncbi:hypothetical protein A3A67_02405 [Candidatus Peribacteria bacterium RIFCSPLOWO2_01_FULL_51_18]|nr:MAG: hypothetical protein A3C52_04805 [Candidatus Peribacteria bacterium RIFCSPHIGHO2_02_FULL_51_15]OGJ66865.1 MAG: hypothetical protein A3A67_02405 [Candidatus Peribacteria bacterium RIFCSPLOWO2_01_FULL_51_18]OGJ69667.1 MAG: hypothetical protein A3J34_02805 [Candidatus Peribacteria bacterium RIFCSPLOWO2_02_FULL_51_10]
MIGSTNNSSLSFLNLFYRHHQPVLTPPCGTPLSTAVERGISDNISETRPKSKFKCPPLEALAKWGQLSIVNCQLVFLAFAITPLSVFAQTSIYDTIYSEAASTDRKVYPTDMIRQFVVDEMKTWQGHGIRLYPGDIDYALEYKLEKLCTDRVDSSGEAIEFITGGMATGQSCMSLRRDILALIAAEQDTSELATDLLTIADGAELALADEPGRAYDMGVTSMLLVRAWIGTGGIVFPWNNTAGKDVETLDSIMSGLSPLDLDRAIVRYQHGYFRDLREADPNFSGIADQVGQALKDVAGKLGIAGDPEAIGQFIMPGLKTPNIGLWARGDDIGIFYKYPVHFIRMNIKPADQFPRLAPGSETLAYPFSYGGSAAPNDPAIKSPVCSRTTGRFGYLCHPLPGLKEGCTDSGPNAITLKQCPANPETKSPQAGPRGCADLKRLFLDDGTPVEDPAHFGQLNPALKPADLNKSCAPETKIFYQDSVSSHACYIEHCLIQSLSGHTLVGNRNTVLANEATSPFLACIRPDPHLGTYTAEPHITSYSLPEYIGHLLAIDYTRLYCIQNGNAPHPLAGFCAYRNNRKANSPDIEQIFTAYGMSMDALVTGAAQEQIVTIGAIIGERAAENQAGQVQRIVFGALTDFVNEITNLVLELKNGPLTKTPCPWTGPIQSSSSSS